MLVSSSRNSACLCLKSTSFGVINLPDSAGLMVIWGEFIRYQSACEPLIAFWGLLVGRLSGSNLFKIDNRIMTSQILELSVFVMTRWVSRITFSSASNCLVSQVLQVEVFGMCLKQ
jgi:xanthosine utilization system XapX-like protein